MFFKGALIWGKRAAGARSSMKLLLVRPRASVSLIRACPWACEVNSNGYFCSLIRSKSPARVEHGPCRPRGIGKVSAVMDQGGITDCAGFNLFAGVQGKSKSPKAVTVTIPVVLTGKPGVTGAGNFLADPSQISPNSVGEGYFDRPVLKTRTDGISQLFFSRLGEGDAFNAIGPKFPGRSLSELPS